MMNKLVLISSFLLILLIPTVMVAASDISGAQYKTQITISNNSTAQTNQPVVFDLSTADMIAHDFLNASATDYAMLANTDTVSMPGWGTNPWCTMVPSIGASSTTFQYLYSKNVTGYTPSYFPGSAGMAVPDSASLELSSNGTIELADTYIDTSTPISLSTTGQDTGTSIAVTMPAGLLAGDLLIVIIEAWDVAGAANPALTPDGSYTTLFHTAVSTQSRFAAYYKTASGSEGASDTWTIDRNSYYSYKALRFTGSTSWAVYSGVTATGAASSPDPPNLATGLGVTPITWLSVAGSFNVATAAPTGYWGLESSGQNSAFTSYAFLNAIAASENPGTFTTAATTWGANTIGIQGLNLYKPIYYKPGALLCAALSPGLITATITGGATVSIVAASGEQNLTLALDSNNITLTFGSTSNTTTLGGVPVPDTANSTQFGGTGTPYIGQMKVTKGGNTKGQWDWGYAATFTDDSGNGNTGTPSFRTTSATGLTANVTATQALYEPTSPASTNVTGGWTIIQTVPTAPSNVFTDGGTGFPLGPQIAAAATEAGDEPEQWIILFVMGFAAAIFIGVFSKTHNTRMGQRGSLILASFCAEGVLMYFYIVEAIPGLALIPAGILLVTLIFWRKSAAPVD